MRRRSLLVWHLSKDAQIPQRSVNTQISPSRTLLFVTKYNVTMETMSSTITKTMLIIATARLIFLIEINAIDSSTCVSYLEVSGGLVNTNNRANQAQQSQIRKLDESRQPVFLERWMHRNQVFFVVQSMNHQPRERRGMPSTWTFGPAIKPKFESLDSPSLGLLHFQDCFLQNQRLIRQFLNHDSECERERIYGILSAWFWISP